ncbi:MAG: cold shock domain-containing protein [Methylobacter sp.]|nr:cold shock domain-containing protein [Methylobacter sp.]
MVIEKGTLVRWLDDKGFGFIKPEAGKDIFIHISALTGMSRKPIIGDVILYQIGFDTQGKTRAINAKIEGVHQVLTIAPLEPKVRTPVPTTRKLTARPSKPRHKLKLLPVLCFIVTAVFIYSKVSKEQKFIDQVKLLTVKTPAVEKSGQFQCQGKVWCSQMSSYEEAIFYLHNCPGTKMDGDSDGIPCEQQF